MQCYHVCFFKEDIDYRVLETSNNKPTVQRIDIPLEGGDKRYIYVDIINVEIAKNSKKVHALIKEVIQKSCSSIKDIEIRYSILTD